MTVSISGFFYLFVVVNAFSLASGESVFRKFDPTMNVTDEFKDYIKDIWCYKTNYLDVCDDLFHLRACFVEMILSKVWNISINTTQHEDAQRRLRDLYEVLNCDLNTFKNRDDMDTNSDNETTLWVIFASVLLCCVMIGGIIHDRIKKGKSSYFKPIEDMIKHGSMS